MTFHRPRVLDASALVELFSGHPEMMLLLEDADDGRLNLAIPTLAVLEAQAVLRATQSMWDHILTYRGAAEIPLTLHPAVATGDIVRARLQQFPTYRELLGDHMIGQVVHEATTMSGVVVTRYAAAYAGHDVAITTIS